MSPFVRDVYTTESNQQLVWVAAARKRNDPTRPMMECMRVEAEEPVPVFSEAEYYRVTCTDGRRLHQARLPATFMPQCMRVDAATFKVLSATTKRLSVIMGKYGGDWDKLEAADTRMGRRRGSTSCRANLLRQEGNERPGYRPFPAQLLLADRQCHERRPDPRPLGGQGSVRRSHQAGRRPSSIPQRQRQGHAHRHGDAAD